jgi:hypothetical protein
MGGGTEPGATAPHEAPRGAVMPPPVTKLGDEVNVFTLTMGQLASEFSKKNRELSNALALIEGANAELGARLAAVEQQTATLSTRQFSTGRMG